MLENNALLAQNKILRSHIEIIERDNIILKKSLYELNIQLQLITSELIKYNPNSVLVTNSNIEISKYNNIYNPRVPSPILNEKLNSVSSNSNIKETSSSSTSSLTTQTSETREFNKNETSHNSLNTLINNTQPKFRKPDKPKSTKILHFKQDLIGHEGAIYTVKFAPSSMLLASCSFDKTVRIWNLNDISSVSIMKDTSRIHCLDWYCDVGFIVTGSDTCVKLWDTNNSNAICNLNTNGFVTSVCVSPLSESIIYASTSHKELIKFDARMPDPVVKIIENDSIIFSSYLFQQGDFIITSDARGFIKTWDSDTGRLVHSFESDPQNHTSISNISVCLPRESEEEGRLLAANCWDNTVRIYNRGAESNNASGFNSINAGSTSTNAITPPSVRATNISPFSNSGNPIMSPIFDSFPSIPIFPKSPINSPFSLNPIHECRGHKNNAWPIVSSFFMGKDYRGKSKWKPAISSEDNVIKAPNFNQTVLLASGSSDNSTCLYDVGGPEGTCKLIQKLEGHKGRVYSTNFHTTEPLLATGGVDGLIKIWGPKDAFL